MDLDKEKKDEAPPENPASPVGSSSSSSAISEVVLWTHSDSSNDDEDELNKAAHSMLDFRSPLFSPLLALKCDSSEHVPVAKGAKQYLNLQQYSKAIPSPSKSPKKSIRAVNELAKKDEDSKKAEDEKPGPSSSSSSTPHFPIPGRRFLAHQLPVYRPRKEHPNTITLMNSSDGPLSVLKRVMTERTRIKIWTRNEKGFRGFLTGFVEAFDKHWNIALRDVDEQFVRKKVIKFPIIGDSICEEQLEKIIEQSESEDKSKIPRETSDTTRNNNGDDNDNKKKEQAISSAFIRLKNYLRQNDGITRKRMGSTSATATTTTVTTTISTQTNKNKSSRKNSPSSSSLNDIAATTKSKTVYVGDMDPLSICRTGLANLSLRDDIHQPKKHDDSSSRSTPTTQIKTRMSTKITKPDIVQCHQTRRSTTTSAGGAECSSSSTSAAASASSSTYSTQQDQQQQQNSPNIISRTSLKKKSLTVFKTPYEDSFGFMVVAQTRKYELVERHVGQVLLMGNDIVFIETSASGS